ncbi:MAG TPA: sulfatase-like hydrolase/transferase [Spirillospora sp.]|nr:sulfatase-like hydrolase/transferase [Spirillospora sp.]
MHEVYAGFLTHTDAQIGRLLDFLDDLGRLDDTFIVVMSDNGAARHPQRAPLLRPHGRHPRGQPRGAGRMGLAGDVPALRVGLGVGGRHPAAALEALHLARRDRCRTRSRTASRTWSSRRTGCRGGPCTGRAAGPSTTSRCRC